MGDVAEVIGGGTPRTSDPTNYENGTVPWITPADLSGHRHKFIAHGRRNITTKGLKSSAAKLLPAGTVLFSSRAPIGYVAIASNPVATNQGFKSFVLQDRVRSDLAYYYLQRARELAVGLASGTTFLEISAARAAQIPIPIPPLDEQDRIVAEIEKHFTRLDAGVASLCQVERRLRAWKGSLVRAAMTGRLVPTEAQLARSSGQRFEDGSQLIRRLTGRDHSAYAQGPYSLPEGWVWASLSTVSRIKGGITKGQRRKPTEVTRAVPYLRVANVQRGYLDLAEVKLIEATESEIAALRLQTGDLLFNEGGDRDKLGRGWIWSSELPECIHQNHVFRARLLSDLEPRFFSLFANFVGHHYFFNQGKQTTNLASINLSKLSRLPVPVAPIAEQRRILAELDRQFSVVEHVEATTAEQLRRGRTLRSGILRLSFSGRL